MSASKIARRYAKSLAELCDEADNHEVIGKQLETFAQTYASSDELQHVMKSPVVSLENKRAVLVPLVDKFLFAVLTRHFLLLLLDNGRIDEIGAISNAFGQLMDAMHNRRRVEVSSPVPLEQQEVARIQSAIERLTGSSITLEAKIDPSLVGGLTIKIDNIVLDGSVQTHLNNLREQFQS